MSRVGNTADSFTASFDNASVETALIPTDNFPYDFHNTSLKAFVHFAIPRLVYHFSGYVLSTNKF